MAQQSLVTQRCGAGRSVSVGKAKQGMHLRATAMRGSSATSYETAQHPDAGPVGVKAKHGVVLVGIGKVSQCWAERLRAPVKHSKSLSSVAK